MTNFSYKLGEPDWNRLARGESQYTLVTIKENNRDLGILSAFGVTWDEPAPYYNAVYPHNKVYSTHNGITVELDDTPENRRIQIYHPSNTYLEIDENGDLVFKNTGDKHEITKSDKYTSVDGNYRKSIHSNYVKLVEEKELIQIKNNKTERIEKNESNTILKNRYEEVGENDNKTVLGNIYTSAKNTANYNADNYVNINGGIVYINSGVSNIPEMIVDTSISETSDTIQQTILEKMTANKSMTMI